MSILYDRRSFLRTAAGASVVAALTPELILADPYAPFTRRDAAAVRAAIRVVGRVTSAGRGIAGVRISDGVSVTRTDSDGRYEILASESADFVFCSLPAGHRIDTNASGTARFYRSLAAESRGEMSALFEL